MLEAPPNFATPVREGVKVMDESNISASKVALVYGQMSEPPGARMRVGLTALTMADAVLQTCQTRRAPHS